MADALSTPTSTVNQQQRSSRTSTVVSSLAAASVLTLASCVAGLCIGVGWRVDQFAFVGVFGLGAFLAVQVSLRSFWSCVLLATITGYLAYLIANPWINWTMEGLARDEASVKVFALVHGVHLLHGGMYSLFAAFWWVSRKWLHLGIYAAPALWLILEAVYPAMFPMRQACLIASVTPLIQIGAIFGVVGVTLQVFAIASLAPLAYLSWGGANRTEDRTAKYFMLAILIFTVINYGWGAYRASEIQKQADNFSGSYLNVGLLQGDTEYAGSNFSFAERSRQLVDCDLVLWPECSFGKYQQDLIDFSDDTQVAKKSTGIGFQFRPLPDPVCHLLGGGYSWTTQKQILDQPTEQANPGFPQRPKIDEKFVSAFLLDPNEQLVGRHDKIELMAGGEYTPFADVFPWLDDWLAAETSDDDEVKLSRGEQASPIGDVNGMSVGALLCCEDMYPRLSRQMTRQGADLLVCLTNGMSFNSDIALRQHFNIGCFRAVENNRYFVRCGSHGISGLISPNGSPQQLLPCFEELDVTLEIPHQQRATTWFCHVGDTLTPASYFTVILLSIFTCFQSTRRRSERSASDGN